MLFLAGLFSSPVFGYLLSQAIRAFYIATNTRPNDRKIDVDGLHSSFRDAISNQNEWECESLRSLTSLDPKQLHRVVWVVYSNSDVRSRSESYWERYYANQSIVAAFVLGFFLSFNFMPVAAVFSLNTIWRIAILLLTIALLWIANKRYIEIASAIENAWIDAFIAKLKREPGSLSGKLFS